MLAYIRNQSADDIISLEKLVLIKSWRDNIGALDRIFGNIAFSLRDYDKIDPDFCKKFLLKKYENQLVSLSICEALKWLKNTEKI